MPLVLVFGCNNTIYEHTKLQLEDFKINGINIRNLNKLKSKAQSNGDDGMMVFEWPTMEEAETRRREDGVFC